MGTNIWTRWCLLLALAACGRAAEDEIERRVRAADRALQAFRFTEGEQHLLAALAVPAPIETRAVLLNNLGFVYHAWGRRQQAESCYRRSIQAWTQTRSPDDLETVGAINNLANHYSETRQFAKLQHLGLDSLASRLSSHAPASRLRAKLLINLGTLERAKGDHAKAERYLLEAIGIFKAEAPGSAELLGALNSLGILLAEAGRRDAGLRYYDEAQQVAAQALPPGDPRLATLLANVAALHLSARSLELADSLNNRALAIAESSLGAEHPLVGQILCNYAAVLRARKNHARADEYERRGLAILHQPSVNTSGVHTIDASDLMIPRSRPRP